MSGTKDTRGITVVEILLVVTLVGVIASIVVPSAVRAGDGLAVRGARNSFVSAHSLARASAIRLNQVSELHIDADAGRFWIEVDTSTFGTASMDTIGEISDLDDQDVRIVSTVARVCFDARGLAWTGGACSSGGSVQFTRRDRSLSVVLTPMGKVMR